MGRAAGTLASNGSAILTAQPGLESTWDDWDAQESHSRELSGSKLTLFSLWTAIMWTVLWDSTWAKQQDSSFQTGAASPVSDLGVTRVSVRQSQARWSLSGLHPCGVCSTL